MDRSFKFAVVALLALNSFVLFSQRQSFISLQPVADVSPSPTVEPTTSPTIDPTPSAEPTTEPSPTPTAEPSTEPSVDPSSVPSPTVSASPIVIPSPTASSTPRPSVTFVAYPAPKTWTDWLNENFETIGYINDGLQNSDNIGLAAYRGWQYGLDLTTLLDERSKTLLSAYMYDVETVVEEWSYHEYDAAISRFNKAIDEWNNFLQYVTTA